ncbi:MAG: amidohydrolase family protein [Actinomycetota bacterium]
MKGSPVIDIHHHIGVKPGLSYLGSQLVDAMDRGGIDVTVVMHFVSTLHKPDDFARANALVANEVERHPGRLVGAVVVDVLDTDRALDALAGYHAVGFRAVKLHPVFHGYYRIDGGAVDPVAELAGSLGMPVAIHCDFAHAGCSPYAVAALAVRHPQTTFILLHLGLQPELCATTPTIVRDVPNVILDTSQTPDAPDIVFARPIREVGADRVVLGSDGPEFDVVLNLRKLELAVSQHGVGEEHAALVRGMNAARLLRLSSAEPAAAMTAPSRAPESRTA